MIVDLISNIENYSPMVSGLAAGMEAIQGWETREPGRYEFEGGYYMIQTGDTKPFEEGLWEAHRKYVDVQMVLEGSEDVGWEDISNLTVATPYNPDKDAEYFEGEGRHIMNISAGMFYMEFPNDGHKAIRHLTSQQHYKKIVMKLPVG